MSARRAFARRARSAPRCCRVEEAARPACAACAARPACARPEVLSKWRLLAAGCDACGSMLPETASKGETTPGGLNITVWEYYTNYTYYYKCHGIKERHMSVIFFSKTLIYFHLEY